MDSIDNQINEVTNQLTIIEQLFEKDLSEWKVKEKNKFGIYEELRKERELLRRKEYQLRELLLEKEKQVTEIVNQGTCKS